MTTILAPGALKGSSLPLGGVGGSQKDPDFRGFDRLLLRETHEREMNAHRTCSHAGLYLQSAIVHADGYFSDVSPTFVPM